MPGHSLFSLLTVQIVKLSQAIYLVSLMSGNWGGGGGVGETCRCVLHYYCTMQDLYTFICPSNVYIVI